VRDQLTRGARIRAILNQPQHAPLRLADEVALVLAVQAGLLDAMALPAIEHFRARLGEAIDRSAPDAVRTIQDTGKLDDAQRQALLDAMRAHARSLVLDAPTDVPAATAAAPARP
jgi:F-type H+-transporting ATPase subunit alpha